MVEILNTFPKVKPAGAKRPVPAFRPCSLPGLARRVRLDRTLRALARDQRGVISILFALLLPLMLGFIGLGVEVGYWFQKHRDLQAAADAAAVSGAYENAEGRSTGVGTIATREAENNNWNSTDGTIAIRSLPYNATYPASGAYTADTDAVEVELTYNLARLFSSWFMSGDMIINARAVGDVVAGASEACVLALGSGNPSGALSVSGASSSVTMSGCTMATNSTDPNAVKNLTGTMSADCVYSAGGVQGTPTTNECSGSKTGQPPVTDPYAGTVTEPADTDFSGCSSYSLTGAGNTDNISAGVYCNISVNATNGTLDLDPGVYYLDQGDFSVSSTNTTINGTGGVTIIFGDSTGANGCGRVNITASGSVNLTAPTTGNFAGIVFYRGPSCNTGSGMTLTGGSSSNIIGAVYAPSADLSMSGGTAISGTCLQLIADTVSFSGSGTIGSDCDGTGVKTIVAGGIGSLVE